MGQHQSKIRILLTGGGSGGHVTPLLGIADAIRENRPDARLLYVGVRHGLESTIVPRAGIPIRYAPSIGMPTRRLSFAMLRFLVTLALGMLRSGLLLTFYRPHAIVASGGYASAPVVLTAGLINLLTLGLWKIPIYMHEQNAVPGRMNTFAGRFATKIGVSHPSASRAFNHRPVEVVGYPVRSSFQLVDRNEARKTLGLEKDDIYLLVFGGSQGARTLNRAVVDALPYLAKRPHLKIMHACGTMRGSGYDARKDTEQRLAALESKPEHYTLADYLHDLPVHLAAADLAVIRAGAGSLVETCATGVPAVVIPKANLPGDSQVANARDLASRGAVEVMYEEPVLEKGRLIDAVSGEALANRLLALIDNQPRRAKLAATARASVDRDAARRIALRVLLLARSVASIDEEPNPPRTDLDVMHEAAASALTASSPTTLRRHVERHLGVRYEQAFEHGQVRDDELAHLEDLEYIRYRGSALLAHPSWLMRNEGVKLIGLTRHTGKRDLLSYLCTDRTPAPLPHRILGGDYVQVGFIRRNVLFAFAFLGGYDEVTRKAVAAAIDDPYYEVRATVMKLIRRLTADGAVMDPEIVTKVRNRTHDRSLEVRWEALHTFGHIGDPEAVLASCREYALATQAPVRDAVLRAYLSLLNRYPNGSGVNWKKELVSDLDRFAITSVSFHPHFPLKERYSALRGRMREEHLG